MTSRLPDSSKPKAHRKLLKRYEEPGHARYLTFSCYDRLPLFSNDKIKEVFVEHLTATVEQHDVPLLAWVIMPEHVHLLVRPDVARVPVPRFLMSLKRPFSRQVLAQWRRLNAAILDRLRDAQGKSHFWLPGGGYDRNIFSDAEVREKMVYIHNNPVRQHLAPRATDWPWSSARWYEWRHLGGPRITWVG